MILIPTLHFTVAGRDDRRRDAQEQISVVKHRSFASDNTQERVGSVLSQRVSVSTRDSPGLEVMS